MDRTARLRSSWPRRQFAVTIAGLIVAGGAAAVAAWPHAWWWLIIIMAVAAALIPAAISAVVGALNQQRNAVRATRAALQGVKGGKAILPLVRDAELDRTAHQAVLPIPYIHRDDEQVVLNYLDNNRPILLVGPSMVGKTKMAAQVITGSFGSWPVIVPDSKRAFAELDAADLIVKGCVIWLDDLDHLIGPDGIRSGTLQRLVATGNKVIATMRAAEYDKFRPTDLIRPPEWDVISGFERIFVTRHLTDREQVRLDAAINDLEIKTQIRKIGIGEYVGAAHQIVEALNLGAAGVGGIGYAMVLGAADWRRAGLNRPIPFSLLPKLAAPHLDERRLARLIDTVAVSEGLSWATREINPNVSLLEPASIDTYAVYDYALDFIISQDVPILDQAWNVILDQASPSELIRIGYTAMAIHGRPDMAARAWLAASDSGNADAALRAMNNLGHLARKQGAPEIARQAFQQVLDSGDADHAPIAAFNLGIVLSEAGDTAGAMAAYQQAIDSGHSHVAPMAMTNLGSLLREQGENERAREIFQKVLDSGDADHTPMAAANLGILLRKLGDAEGAMAAYQRAIDSGHRDVAPAAAGDLGKLLQELGDTEGAMAAYQRAIDSGHPAVAPIAMVNLGKLLEELGDAEGAMASYQRAIDSGNPTAAAMARRRAGNAGP
jgi:tetratricopeptide (TPR) repeat protein